jgi:hypothetical protein
MIYFFFPITKDTALIKWLPVALFENYMILPAKIRNTIIFYLAWNTAPLMFACPITHHADMPR